MERLKGKNVLVTGASSGIGQAIAVRFAREGANVAINYRSGAEQADATRVMAKAARSNGSGRELRSSAASMSLSTTPAYRNPAPAMKSKVPISIASFR